jgi:hypothetical protein
MMRRIDYDERASESSLLTTHDRRAKSQRPRGVGVADGMDFAKLGFHLRVEDVTNLAGALMQKLEEP